MTIDYKPATIQEVQDHLADTQAYLQVLVHRLGGSVRLTYDDYISYALDTKDKTFSVDIYKTGEVDFIFRPNTDKERVEGTLYVGRPRIDEAETPINSTASV